MQATPLATAPGPPGHPVWGHLHGFRRDVLGLMTESARKHGDVVRFRLGPMVMHLLNHPDHVQRVLVRRASNFDKGTRSASFIRGVVGESLLTANGDYWQRQRRLLQPSFHRTQIPRFLDPMIEATQAMLQRWRQRPALGTPVDVAEEMARLTFVIAGRTLFNAEVGADADSLNAAMQVILPHTFDRIGRTWNPPDWLPTPANRRFRHAVAQIDTTVHRIIQEHRHVMAETGAPPPGLLGLLLQVRDEATGEGLNDTQLRNETITFLLAGHETTANALTWTFHLLGRHPDALRRMREEAASVLKGRTPTMEDLPQLAFTRCVLFESMRLYPPIWVIERRVIAEDEAGGFRLPAGSAVVISPYALHRHPSFWERPEAFDPSRFEQPAPEAYIPFGAGPRFCIGREFALMEAQLVLAMVVRLFDLTPIPNHPVSPWPGITLRTRHGLPMTVRPA